MQEVKCRILFVENNEDTRHVMSMLMEIWGYEVTDGHTLADGLRLARSGSFDLYLLDSRFPDGKGVELCRKIREFDLYTPILFYSAAAYEKDKQEAIAAGAQGYITKPAHPDELELTISQFLNNECSSPVA